MSDSWKGNDTVFKTYVKGNPSGDGKHPASKVKGKNQILSFEDASKNECFGAILNDGFVDISFDTDDLSQKFWDMAEGNNWKCLILENPTNGHIHSYWRDTRNRTGKDGKDKKLAVGLIADIHSGSTYIPLRVHGSNRFPPSYEPDQIDEVPDELLPVDTNISLLDMKSGDGRNDSIFRYILVLQGQLQMNREEIKGVLENTNKYIFTDPLDERELETITRDEAFEKPIFYKGKNFLHNRFGDYLIRTHFIVKIDGKLHVYREGTYTYDPTVIEKMMLMEIPTLTDTKRKEVLKYLNVMCSDAVPASPRMIAFKNGVLNLDTDELLPFSPDYIITNKIPWDYNPEAYDHDADAVLNRIACDDPEIRSLLEECIGYCFYRQNVIQKAFILIGEKSNGKSTFISVMNRILGDENISAMDLKNLGDRFSKATLFKKLANIGDDISDEFIPDASLFKKIVSGERIQAEFKGQDLFEFNPYVKLLFSANNMPRIRDKTGAVQRRLVIIPFQAVFSEDDPDFDPDIKRKLYRQSSMEYFIRLGVAGLKKVLGQKRFTKSSKVQKELDDYEEFNNPVIGFFKDMDEGYLYKEEAKVIHLAYSNWCRENGYTPESKNQFGRTLKSLYGVESRQKTINRKSVRMYVKINE